MTGIRSAVAVALCAVATSFVVPAAQASPPMDAPAGRRCSYSAMSDPDPAAADDTMTGQVNGGPLLWDRDFWLHCHLQVDDSTHADPATVAADRHGSSLPHDGNTATDEVAVLAGHVSYVSPVDVRDDLCSSVSWPTATGPNWLYWTPGDDGPDGVQGSPDDNPGRWSPDPDVPCLRPPQVIPEQVIGLANELFAEVIDPAVCLALIQAHQVLDPEPSSGPQPGDAVYVDAEGDVFVDDGDGITEADWVDDLFWDCPGYVDRWTPGPGADGYPVVDTGPSPSPALGAAVAGHVVVTMSPGDAAPTFTLAGVLAVPALWDCSATPYVTSQPYTVTCDRLAAEPFRWDCQVLHADVTTTSSAGAARAAAHCDGDAVPEVQTHPVTGVGGHDSRVRPVIWTMPVTQFRCTVSNGSGAAPVPGFVAGCGDPGAVRVEAHQ